MSRRLSLQTRFLFVALVAGVGALVFASVAISGVLERFVVRSLDERLDTQIEVLVRAVGPAARFERSQIVELPGFASSERGWAWRVRTPAGEWNSGSPIVEEHFRDHSRRHRPDAMASGEGETADGMRVHLRRLSIPMATGSLDVIAAGPRKLVDQPLLAALGTLALSVLLLGLGLAFATWIQLRFGLQPLHALRAEVARVRSGASDHLPTDQPKELKPLAEEVNALVEHNRAGLAHARRHLANLAHGLKTPLATLTLRLEREGVSAETRALLAQLDASIAHHLRRARSGAPAAAGRARTQVQQVGLDLIDALQHIHVDRNVVSRTSVESDAIAAVDQRDLEEILGNLLDNAFRHARHTVQLDGRADGKWVQIGVADDGPGLSDAQIRQALEAGVRLDESEVGYGFGLSIVQELAELYGGQLSLGSSPLGGLVAQLRLPRAMPHAM